MSLPALDKPPYLSRHFYDLCTSLNWYRVKDCHREVESLINDGDAMTQRNKRYIQLNIKYVLKFKDDWGNTPLHIACYNNAPLETIDYLLKLSDIAGLGEDENVNGQVLIDEVVTSQTANNGSTPILAACSVPMSLNILKRLLFYHFEKTGPGLTRQAVCLSDSLGSSPLSALLANKLTATDQLTELNKIKLLVCALQGKLNSYSDTSVQDYYYRYDARTFDNTFVLQVLSVYPFACPSMGWMKSFAADVDRHGLLDETGMNEILDVHGSVRRHLLHRAIDTSYIDICKRVEGTYVWNEEGMIKILHSQSIIVHYLLKMFPEAGRAKIKIRHRLVGRKGKSSNASGEARIINCWRTPLCHAISKGLWWDTGGGTVVKFDGKSIQGPISSLAYALPEMVQMRDEQSGLYPFMLAAAMTNLQQEDESDVGFSQGGDDEFNIIRRLQGEGQGTSIMSGGARFVGVLQLSTIYGLLRHTPQVIEHIAIR